MAILELKQLRKYFATQKAVDDISLVIEQGQIFGLLGPNGAGKTTLIRMITGIFYPDQGEIVFNRKQWDQLNFSKQLRLVLHEYLGIIGLDDTDYRLSGTILRELGYYDLE